MLSRAQCVPLAISHTIPTYDELSDTKQIFSMCITRTKELAVRTTKEVMGDVLEKAFSLTVPLLTALDLCELGRDEEPYPDPELIEYVDVEHDVCVPPIVFEHSQLERLRLQGIPLPRALTSFSNLVSLSLIKSIHFDGEPEQLRLAPSDIIDILRDLPKLQELFLHRCFLGHAYPTPLSLQSVHLDELVSLNVQDSAHAVRDILEGLVLPPSSSISLHLWILNEDIPLDGADPIASIFGGPLAAHVSSARNIRTVSIDPVFSFYEKNVVSSYAKITSWPVNLLLRGPVDLSSTPYHPCMSLSWNYSYRSDPATVLSRILDMWDTTHVEALLLHHVSLSQEFRLIDPNAFPNVQQISLDGLEIPFMDASKCLHALRAVLLGQDAEEISHYTSVTFPKLTSISMHCTDDLPAFEPAPSEWRRELLCLLKDRRSIQNHFSFPSSLYLVGWPKDVVDAEFSRELSEIVPVVRFDPR